MVEIALLLLVILAIALPAAKWFGIKTEESLGCSSRENVNYVLSGDTEPDGVGGCWVDELTPPDPNGEGGGGGFS